MIRILSWIVAICIGLYILGILTLPFFAVNIVPVFIKILLIIGGISAVLLITLLIFERIKDRKEENDDLNKY